MTFLDVFEGVEYESSINPILLFYSLEVFEGVEYESAIIPKLSFLTGRGGSVNRQ